MGARAGKRRSARRLRTGGLKVHSEIALVVLREGDTIRRYLHLTGNYNPTTARLYTDMGPFRAIRRTSLAQLQMSELTYGWNLEMQIKASTYHLRVQEIPVDYRRRIGGTSKVSGNLRASIKAAFRILLVLFRTTFARPG